MALYYFTFTVNFLALITALWLGLYLVTRSPRYLIAWLTAAMLWSLAGLFLNILLALNPPPIAHPSWLRFMFPFWPSGAFEQGASAWLQGWSVAPAVAFWHHATMLMRPGKLNPWRWTRILGGYVLAIAAVELQAFTQILFSIEGGDPLYLNSLRATSLYPIFGLALIVMTAACAINLIRSMWVAPSETSRRQLRLLAAATLVTGLTIPISMAASWLNLFPIPMVILSIILAVFVAMIGYGVARYSALVEGRTIARDFLYNIVMMTAVTVLYLMASYVLIVAYEAPPVILILIPILAIFTHSAMSIASRLMDRFFYKDETLRLRSNLRKLTRMAGEDVSMQENLRATLNTLCTSIRARYGLIFAIDDRKARLISDFRWHGLPIELSADALCADDVMHVEIGRIPYPLHEAALLVPLYRESEQLGALLLGQPSNGIRYAAEDVDRVLHPADLIADALYSTRRKSEYLARLTEVAEEHRAHSAGEIPAVPAETVESALRNLYDYAFLGDTPLKDMAIVQKRLRGQAVTHLERGKAVQAVLLEALEQMRPGREVPRDPPPREWYAYTILHDAYLDNVPNRDIMSRLYISEGTFNRTRRAAIRSLARALAEMEHSV